MVALFNDNRFCIMGLFYFPTHKSPNSEASNITCAMGANIELFGKLNRTSYISVPVLHVILRSFLLSVFDYHISASIRHVMITEDKVNS